MSEQMLPNRTIVQSVVHNRPAENVEKLLGRLHDDVVFLEGLSYALPEDGAKQLRRRVQLMYKNVKEFLMQGG